MVLEEGFMFSEEVLPHLCVGSFIPILTWECCQLVGAIQSKILEKYQNFKSSSSSDCS